MWSAEQPIRAADLYVCFTAVSENKSLVNCFFETLTQSQNFINP